MAMEEKRNPLSIKFVEQKENAVLENVKVSRAMKTIPQSLNKVCQPLRSHQNKEHVNLGLGTASMTKPTMSTKSPITSRPIKSAKRKGLATLQQSASDKSIVVGSLRMKGLFQKEAKQNKFEVFCEEKASKPESVPKPKVNCASAGTQTDFDEWLSLEESKKPDNLAEEALALMRSEPSKEDYYKEIAEQRREALEETLQENEELYDELERLKQKCSDLEKSLNEAESYKLLYLAMVEKNEAEKNEAGKNN